MKQRMGLLPHPFSFVFQSHFLKATSLRFFLSGCILYLHETKLSVCKMGCIDQKRQPYLPSSSFLKINTDNANFTNDVWP